MSTSRRLAVTAYVTLGLIWGTNFVFMTWATQIITPGQTTLLRIIFGAAPIALFTLARGHLHRWHLRHLHHFVVMSILASGLYYYAYAAGTQRLDSGIAGSLSGTIPLFATLGAVTLLAGERLTRARVLGLGVGLLGVLLLAAPWQAAGVDLAGVIWMLIGSASLGFSFAYAKRYVTPLGIHPAAAAAYQMGLAAIGLTVITDLSGVTDLADDPRALVAVVVGLGLLGTGVAFVLYYVAVAGLGASTASTCTYIPPAVAMLIGVLALDEPFRPAALSGLLLVIIGAVLAHRPQSRRPSTNPVTTATPTREPRSSPQSTPQTDGPRPTSR